MKRRLMEAWFPVLLVTAALLSGCGVIDALVGSPPSTTGRVAVCAPTAPNPAGPYYVPGAPMKANLIPEGAPGAPVIIAGTVYSADCQPLANAKVDVWQADAGGEYDFSDQFRFRGYVLTDEQGRYQFTTVYPGNYGSRPAHIHLTISHDQTPSLTTQLYFAGDPQNNVDGMVDPSLVISLTPDGEASRGTFDIVLPG